ncbi:MAG: zincin-like metallopeptidase domain-containing protein [Planctomycetaceae bacterium]|nr:zincin-like metallopeptidase domain-containing protein [Planctomycetaceae bacterium]
MTATTRTDIYTRVTDRIVEQLSQGVRPWLQPWKAEHAAGRITRPLRHNGQRYSGINILTLWMSAELQGFVSPFWMTFQQAKELGGHVKKGEHGSPVVYAATFKKKEQADDGQETEAEIPFLKEYTVFCADQCEGLPAHFYATPPRPTSDITPIETAMQFFEATGATLRIGGNRAFYAMEPDYIALPCIESFRDAESHASVLCHELTHWTRHPSRLNREFGRKKWGDEGYAMEELVAELGSAFLCADVEITSEVRDDHASYIDSWLKVLKDDNRAVFSAASQASKAVDFLHGLQPQPAA